MKALRIISTLLLSAVLLTACSNGEGSSSGSENKEKYDMSIKGNVGGIEIEKGDKIAVISVKDFGEIKIKLFSEAAPIGVENFIKLAERGYYDGKNIHRVYADFMIQGGSLNGDGTGGYSADGGTFDVEYHPNARHIYGAISYANTGLPSSNTCQFFIVNSKKAIEGTYFDSLINNQKMENIWSEEVRNNYAEKGGAPYLDKSYTVFGQTFEGFDVLDKISAVEVTQNESLRNEKSKPVSEIIIESVTIYTHGEQQEEEETTEE